MHNLGAVNDVFVSGMVMVTWSHASGDEQGVQSASAVAPDSMPRMEKIELSFDVMSVLQQLRHALSGDMERATSHFVVPNRLKMLQPNELLPRIIVQVDDPAFPIINANSVWTELFHGRTGDDAAENPYQQPEVIGLSLRYLLSDFKLSGPELHTGTSAEIIKVCRSLPCLIRAKAFT